jgi:hypothetical protein
VAKATAIATAVSDTIPLTLLMAGLYSDAVRVDDVPRCVHGLPRANCVFCSKTYWPMMLAWALGVVLGWLVFGPDHWTVPLMLTSWTWMLGPGAAAPVMTRVPHRWFRVAAGERVLHRWLGVGLFGRLLDRSGWNRRFAGPMRGFDGSKAGLRVLERSVQGAASAHGASFTVHAAASAVALFTGHPRGALWILLPGVALHLYPVLLQRSIMLRLQPTLDRMAPCD